jgi:hypothetical protein
MSEVAERIQQEVAEIAEVLARRQGKLVREVWTEALTLHRVRYETGHRHLDTPKLSLWLFHLAARYCRWLQSQSWV